MELNAALVGYIFHRFNRICVGGTLVNEIRWIHFSNLHLENDTAVDEEKPRVPKGPLEV